MLGAKIVEIQNFENVEIRKTVGSKVFLNASEVILCTIKHNLCFIGILKFNNLINFDEFVYVFV